MTDAIEPGPAEAGIVLARRIMDTLAEGCNS